MKSFLGKKATEAKSADPPSVSSTGYITLRAVSGVNTAVLQKNISLYSLTSVMYPVLLTLGGSALLASVAFFAKKLFIGEELFSEEGEGGEERRPAQCQQHRVHHAPRRLGREHRRPGNNLYGA